jgi:hypothetical protein
MPSYGGSTQPILCVDNQYDRVFLYPAAVVDASSQQTDREPWRLVDGRRERTYWQPATDAEHWVRSTLGVGNEQYADFWWMDRGHNRWGTTIYPAEFGSEGATWPLSIAATIPPLASGRIPVGGSPFGGVAVTEEGACYGFFPKTGPWLWRRTRFPALGGGTLTTIPGFAVGLKHQFTGYSGIFDPDKGERTQIQGQSRVGYRAVDTTYSWRMLELRFQHIARAEYFDRIRSLSALLFKRNQPCYALPNAGLYPTIGGLFQYDGTQYSAPTERTYHRVTYTLREVGHLID